MAQLRTQRNTALTKTDHLLRVDSQVYGTDLDLVKVYRQQLRDLPSLYTAENVGTATIPDIVLDSIQVRLGQT